MEDSSKSIEIIKQEYDIHREIYIIHLGEFLMSNKTYKIAMNFIGFLKGDLGGFYRSSYRDESGNTK